MHQQRQYVYRWQCNYETHLEIKHLYPVLKEHGVKLLTPILTVASPDLSFFHCGHALGPSGMEYIVLLGQSTESNQTSPTQESHYINRTNSQQSGCHSGKGIHHPLINFVNHCCTILVKIQSRVEFSIFLSLSDPGACSKPSSGKNISCFNVSMPLASCGMCHLLRLSQNDAK